MLLSGRAAGRGYRRCACLVRIIVIEQASRTKGRQLETSAPQGTLPYKYSTSCAPVCAPELRFRYEPARSDTTPRLPLVSPSPPAALTGRKDESNRRSRKTLFRRKTPHVKERRCTTAVLARPDRGVTCGVGLSEPTGRASNRTTARRGLHPSPPSLQAPGGCPSTAERQRAPGAALSLHFRQAPGAAWTRARP